MKKIPEPRVPLRSSARQSQQQANKTNMSRDPAPRARMTPSVPKKTPLVKSSVKKRSHQETPKQAGKSFAPKHFEFRLNVPMPEKPAVLEVAESEERPFDKNSSGSEAAMEVVPSTKTPEATPGPGRRSRRVSGVQPDLSLTPAQLRTTPAKRAKQRSVSRDRRRSVRYIEVCPEEGPHLGSAVKPVLPSLTEEHQHDEAVENSERPKRSTRRSLKENTKQVDTPEKADNQEEEKTPDLKESLAKMATLTLPSTLKKRRTRMSMKVIEEAEGESKDEEVNKDNMTPISNLTDKIKNAVIESERKEDSFKTPKSSRVSKVKAATENAMRVMSPLSSVNKVRGSSKRKRTSPEAKDSVASLFENLEGSPLLAKLEAKLMSNQEITDDDFLTEAPVSKQMRLEKEFDAIAEENKVSKEEEEKLNDVSYFRRLLKSETERLTEICNKWELKLQENSSQIDEDIQGEIRSVIGQGRLVMAERFTQFKGLVDNCEFKLGEKETTTTDLMGFWEMIYFQVIMIVIMMIMMMMMIVYFQVSDVDKKFGKIQEIENNEWKEVVPKTSVIKKKIAKKPAAGGPKKVASSGLRAMIAAKRKAAMVQIAASDQEEVQLKESPLKESKIRSGAKTKVVVVDQSASPDNHFDGGFFKITSPARQSPSASPKDKLTPHGPPLGGDRLRRVAVLNDSHRRSVSGLMLSPFITKVRVIQFRYLRWFRN